MIERERERKRDRKSTTSLFCGQIQSCSTKGPEARFLAPLLDLSPLLLLPFCAFVISFDAYNDRSHSMGRARAKINSAKTNTPNRRRRRKLDRDVSLFHTSRVCCCCGRFRPSSRWLLSCPQSKQNYIPPSLSLFLFLVLPVFVLKSSPSSLSLSLFLPASICSLTLALTSDLCNPPSFSSLLSACSNSAQLYTGFTRLPDVEFP